MKLYKLINGALVSAPNNLTVNGQLHSPASYEVLISEGYKPLTTAERPTIEWFERHVISYTEDDKSIFEQVTIAPIDNLKNSYIQRLNSECDVAIVSGFIFTDSLGVAHPVWLSMENQFNFSQVKIPCELKIGEFDWITFTEQSELDRFKDEIITYITGCLQICWKPKRDIELMDDAQVYTYIKSL